MKKVQRLCLLQLAVLYRSLKVGGASPAGSLCRAEQLNATGPAHGK